MLVIDVQYVEQLKENVTGIHRVQIVLKRNQECIYPDVDKRKKRYSIEYITNLENTNQQLHDQIQSLIDLKDNPYQLHLKITEILESSSLFLDNSETKLDSSLGSPELSKSEASLANSFTLGGELVVSSREQGANFHAHLNQQQPQQQQHNYNYNHCHNHYHNLVLVK